MPERRCEKCHAAYPSGERFCPLDGGAILELADAPDSLVGRTIDGRYLVRRLLGRGGMGSVYVADHVGLDKQVAIKFMLPHEDRDATARFHREARAASRVSHEHVVHVFDVGHDSGRDYIVMEFIEGRDLEHELAGGPVAVERAIEIARQMLAGLDAIHAAGLIHRDIKPANVVLATRDGERDFVKIMDFGVAKTTCAGDDTVTGASKVVGTPKYMAPEQLAGLAVDHRADLYAAALVLLEMLGVDAPASPFSRGDHALAELPARIPRELARTLERALAPKSADRFASAREFRDALADGPAARRDEVATVDAKPRPRDEPRAGSHRRRAWILGAIAFAAAGGVVAWSVLRQPSSAPVAPAQPPSTPDHRELARAAERAGKLDAAIAEYQEALAAGSDADPLFHLGELSERLGRREEAARYFERYLRAAPAAADRATVTARIEALRSAVAPAAIDAGIPIDAAAAHRPVAASRERPGYVHRPGDQECSCQSETVADGVVSKFALCHDKRSTPVCPCVDPAGISLCSVDMQQEDDGHVVHDPKYESGTFYCVDQRRPECTVVGEKPDSCKTWRWSFDARDDGKPCDGYFEHEEHHGAYSCHWCESTSFWGHEGAACVGLRPSAGDALDHGVLHDCRGT